MAFASFFFNIFGSNSDIIVPISQSNSSSIQSLVLTIITSFAYTTNIDWFVGVFALKYFSIWIKILIFWNLGKFIGIFTYILKFNHRWSMRCQLWLINLILIWRLWHEINLMGSIVNIIEIFLFHVWYNMRFWWVFTRFK